MLLYLSLRGIDFGRCKQNTVNILEIRKLALFVHIYPRFCMFQVFFASLAANFLHFGRSTVLHIASSTGKSGWGIIVLLHEKGTLYAACMPPLPVLDNVTLPDIISSLKNCFRESILSLTLTQIYSKQALKIVCFQQSHCQTLPANSMFDHCSASFSFRR